jgi:hypothetical protein
MIENDPKYKPGEPVNLNSCNTGSGNNPYAQQLAKALQAPVKAPNQYDWYYPNGTVAPYPALNGDLSQGPDTAHPGQVNTFNPPTVISPVYNSKR